MTGQAKLCQMLMDRLYESVATRDTLLAEQKHLYCGETFSATTGAGKTQIKADIKRLRRELQFLSELVESR